MKQRLHIIILIGTLLASCGDSILNPQTSDLKSESDTLYTEAKAMSIHLREPERALVIIDSAVTVGNITWERGEYLKAVTRYGQGNFALVRKMCLDLLECRPTHWTKPDDLENQEHIYSLLEAVEYTSGNFPAVIRYATEASRLAHTLNHPAKYGEMEGEIAHALAETGKTDEGIDRLRAVIAELREMDTFNGVIAFHSTAKKLLHILLNHQRHAEMVTVCEDVLARIDEFASHPENFDKVPDGFDPAEFADFARGQTLAFLTTAYARAYTAAENKTSEITPSMRAELLRKALSAEAEMFKTKWSQTPGCGRMMSAAYHHLGQFDHFDAAIAQMDSAMTDSVSINHAIRLGLRATAAQMRGRLAEAIGYLNRKIVISDSIVARNQRDQLNELATVYHLQEEQLARQEAEADARVFRVYSLFLCVALIAAISFLLWFFRQKRIMEKKNRVLVREISEAIKYKEKYEETLETNSRISSQTQNGGGQIQEAGEYCASVGEYHAPSVPASDADLYLFLRQAIMRDQFFLDPQLDRQQLVDRFGLSKERIGAAFAKGSPYKSLIDFLTDCRLPYAAKMLTERPDLTIAEVSLKSGFTSLNTFGRNFKQKYAITPSQFREQQA